MAKSAIDSTNPSTGKEKSKPATKPAGVRKSAGPKLTPEEKKRAAVIDKIRALMEKHGLTTADLKAAPNSNKRFRLSGGDAPPKAFYRNPATGEQWDGTGPTPKWLQELEAANQLRDKFRIKQGWGRLPAKKVKPKKR